jgi:ectoine hydroxylase-related dioxygenase (phytanoyl-CoA dioxygenase family)
MLREVSAALDRQSQAGGSIRGSSEVSAARNLLEAWPGVVGLARRPRLQQALTQVLGRNCGLVRGLYFDKPPGASWALPWHKDMTIAVKRNDLRSGLFSKPTRKAGVPHVEAPESVLQSMLTARIHLDDVDDENGPLLIVPGSHCSGKQPVVPAGNAIIRPIHVSAGDALLMRPLLSHSSSYSREGTSRHRRTIHLEFAPGPLPDNYEWHEFVRLIGEDIA